MTVHNIEKQLLKLDVDDRARLASRLLSSLDELSETENEKLWALEAFERHQALTKGTTKPKLAHQVFKNARARFK